MGDVCLIYQTALYYDTLKEQNSSWAQIIKITQTPVDLKGEEYWRRRLKNYWKGKDLCQCISSKGLPKSVSPEKHLHRRRKQEATVWRPAPMRNEITRSPHSHSVVPGGLDVRSYITLEIPGMAMIASAMRKTTWRRLQSLEDVRNDRMVYCQLPFTELLLYLDRAQYSHPNSYTFSFMLPSIPQNINCWISWRHVFLGVWEFRTIQNVLQDANLCHFWSIREQRVHLSDYFHHLPTIICIDLRRDSAKSGHTDTIEITGLIIKYSHGH